MRKLFFAFASLTILCTLGLELGGADSVDCDDFSSIDEAYDFFYRNGGPDRDPYYLDGDGDGLVCEWGVGGGGSTNSLRSEVYVPESPLYEYDPSDACDIIDRGEYSYEVCSGDQSDNRLGPFLYIGYAIVAGVVVSVVAGPVILFLKILNWVRDRF